MDTNTWIYVGFTIFVLGTLALDLGVFHRKAHVVQPKEAGIWIAVWTCSGSGFRGDSLLLAGARSSRFSSSQAI